MELTELYEKGEALLRQKDIGWLLDGVETGFVLVHDRKVLDFYTFRECCIDASEAKTTCRVMGVEFSTPVIMSAMTMPIPAIVDNGLMEVAQGLKESGSLMWTGRFPRTSGKSSRQESPWQPTSSLSKTARRCSKALRRFRRPASFG
jgi:hypothetical protein